MPCGQAAARDASLATSATLASGGSRPLPSFLRGYLAIPATRGSLCPIPVVLESGVSSHCVAPFGGSAAARPPDTPGPISTPRSGLAPSARTRSRGGVRRRFVAVRCRPLGNSGATSRRSWVRSRRLCGAHNSAVAGDHDHPSRHRYRNRGEAQAGAGAVGVLDRRRSSTRPTAPGGYRSDSPSGERGVIASRALRSRAWPRRDDRSWPEWSADAIGKAIARRIPPASSGSACATPG